MSNFISEICLDNRRDKFVSVKEHYRHMDDGRLVFIPAYYRRKWGTSK